jgi:hypothetical protein
MRFHVDRDGHFGGAKASASIIRRMPDNCLCSEIDCSNHSSNLTENSLVEAVGDPLTTWMYDTAIFLWLGDHSLRLVHGVSQLVERYFPRPVVGAPPDADRAKAFGDELESLHTFHWMALEHDTDGASRDVDDLFGRGNQRAKTYIKA